MCRVLSANKAGFYACLHKPLSDRAIEDQRLLTLIRDSHAGSGRVYGAGRVFADLREAGERCGKNRVTRIMHETTKSRLSGDIGPPEQSMAVPPSWRQHPEPRIYCECAR